MKQLEMSTHLNIVFQEDDDDIYKTLRESK